MVSFVPAVPLLSSVFLCHAGEKYEKKLVQMFEGHYFGELALIYEEPRTASVRATDEASFRYNWSAFKILRTFGAVRAPP